MYARSPSVVPAPNYRRIIIRAFQPYGLSLQGDAAKLLTDYLSDKGLNGEECDATLKQIVSLIKDGLRSRIVDSSAVSSVLAKLLNSRSQTKKEMIMVFNAFATPRFRYEAVRKTFERIPHQSALHGSADAKAWIHIDRYQLLHQQLQRNEDFNPPTTNSMVQQKNKKYWEISQIESLTGQSGKRIIFGMLTQLYEGKWFIEDMITNIQVDLSEAKLTAGIFTEGCMVVARGKMKDGIFIVELLGFPPLEVREDTLQLFPQLECFGHDFDGRDKEKEKSQMLKALFTERKNDMVVILSDIYLDKPMVLTKLRSLFKGFQEIKPPLFVFMGNFASKTHTIGMSDAKKVKGYFDAFADLILEFPAIYKNSKLVFIPGPQDPGLGNSLPRPPLPHFFTQRLRKIPHANIEFASNPCRILYYGKEYVFFREDLLHKMRRNCIKPLDTEESTEPSEHLVKTLLDQAHLCPLPIMNRPIYWNYDHSLRLYPLPHLLVLADIVDQYDFNLGKCHSLNPGCFSSDFSFVVYWPAKGEAEFSRIEN